MPLGEGGCSGRLGGACSAAALASYRATRLPARAQVEQEELERYDGVAPGKYTAGLGQRRMAFCGDQEDVVSIALTAVKRLLEKYDVDPRDIGRCVREGRMALGEACCVEEGAC